MPSPPTRPGQSLVDRGLEAYRRGDAKGALAAWEQALAVRPGDGQLSALVDYLKQQISGGGKIEFEAGFGDAEQKTNPELAQETLERVLRAERDAADSSEPAQGPPHRRTLISGVSEFLAPATRKEWPDERTEEVPPLREEGRDKP